MKKIEAIQILQKSGKKIFTLSDLKKFFHTEIDNTTYKQAEGLIKSGVLERAAKGLYFLSSNKPSDFELANALYQPSYVSLESALNYFGILVQSPQQIISVTTARTKKITSDNRNFVYVHIDPKYYSNYQRVENFLIATPEKALIDAIFFAALGRNVLSSDELILDSIDKRKLKEIVARIKNKSFKKYFGTLKI